MTFKNLFISISVSGLLCQVVQAQKDSVAESLTLEQIMADPDWIGRAPEHPRWSHDGAWIVYQRKQKGSDVREWFRVDRTSTKSTRIPLKDLSTALPAAGDFDGDYRRIVFTRDGDLFLRDLKTDSLRQLTKTSSIESGAAFLSGAQRIQFRRDGILLIRDLRTGLESEPLVIKFEDAPPEDKKPPTEFVARREQEMFEYLQRQEFLQDASKSADKGADEANPTKTHPPVYLGKGMSSESQTLSNNTRWLAVVVSKTEGSVRSRHDRMPVWVREDGYVENRDVRSLVGNEPEPPQQLKLIEVRTRKVIDLDLSRLPEVAVDRLAWLKNAAGTNGTDDKAHTSHKSHPDSTTTAPDEPQPRPIAIQSVRFSADSKFLLFQCFSTDNKDRWIVCVKLSRLGKEGALNVVHHRYDEAWIGSNDTDTGWINDTSTVWFISEDSGYAHLSAADAATGRVRALTTGSFEVSSPRISRDGTTMFITSNETHPGNYELWSVDIESRERRQLTDLGGVNEFTLSFDEQSAIAVHSEATRPPELVLVRLDGSEPPKPLTHTTTKRFRAVKWTPPRFIEVPSRHGGVIHSRVYLPEDAWGSGGSGGEDDASKDRTNLRPAVVFVHGAGYLQNAHQGWSVYFREFMFHTLLTQKGFVVLDMDYRASAGYGRDWRTAIYRQMGTPEVEDLADGVKWLSDHHQVDPARVGVYGGSYGGFLTLMSLFREPDLFACGAALRPVTDWAHNNHDYTSNILNTPEVDPDAYNASSPINFAEGLQNPLLICHGMIDDNVFFKDTVRLTQRLIELKKDNWTAAMYPVEPHAFRQPSSWRDEYQRILDLFERELTANE